MFRTPEQFRKHSGIFQNNSGIASKILFKIIHLILLAMGKFSHEFRKNSGILRKNSVKFPGQNSKIPVRFWNYFGAFRNFSGILEFCPGNFQEFFRNVPEFFRNSCENWPNMKVRFWKRIRPSIWAQLPIFVKVRILNFSRKHADLPIVDFWTPHYTLLLYSF